MGVQMMNFLPIATKSTGTNGSGKSKSGQGFDGLLESLSSKRAKAQARDPEPTDTTREVAARARRSAQLANALEQVAGGKVDLSQPGLGLTKDQQQQLAARLAQLLRDAESYGSPALGGLASLVASGQLASVMQTQPLAEVSKLLGIDAGGSASTSALLNNVRFLTQAIQLVADSDGKLTLAEAVEQLGPADDVFAEELKAVLNHGNEPGPNVLDGPLAASTGPPRARGSGELPRDGPESGPVSATAGSNGRELTPVPTAGSPADGAAQEASPGQALGISALDVSALADALEALIEGRIQRLQGQDQSPVVANREAEPAEAVRLPGQPSSEADLPAKATLSTPETAVMQFTVTTAQAVRSSGMAESAVASPMFGEPASGGPADGTGALVTAIVGDGDQQASADTHSDSRPATSDNRGQPIGVAGAQVSQVVATTAGVASTPGAAEQVTARAAIERAIVDQIVQNATVALRNGQQEFRIQFKPEFLGSMEVRIAINGGVAMVRMAAENAATRQLIDANIEQLRQAFGTGEVRIEHVPHFASSEAPWSFDQGGHHGYWHGQNPHDGSGGLPEAIPFNGSEQVDDEVSQAASETQDSGLRTQDSTLAPVGAIDIKA